MPRLPRKNALSARILFIHGFGSCGNGAKSTALREYFGMRTVLSPDLDVDPARAVGSLEQILDAREIDMLVGSSLGGFFAVWLNRRRPLPTVLINPAMQPWQTLAPWVGINRHWCTGDSFELTVRHLDMLRTFSRPPDTARERYLVLLSGADEVLDHTDAARRFSDFDVRIEPHDDHRFHHLKDYLPVISGFRERSSGDPPLTDSLNGGDRKLNGR